MAPQSPSICTVANISLNHVSVLGRDKGHTFKHSPLTERVSETQAQENSQGQGLYLTFNPELSPNTDSRGKTGVSNIFVKPNLRLKSTPV